MARRGHFGLGAVREALGLARGQVLLAVASGLLVRDDRTKSFDRGQIERIARAPGEFLTALAAEVRLNATQAARHLGVSPARFRSSAEEVGLPVVDVRAVRLHGQWVDVRYWRAGDVETLRGSFATDPAGIRAEAARKATRTRSRNREEGQAAYERLLAARPSPAADPVVHLAWASCLAELSPRLDPEHELRRYADRIARADGMGLWPGIVARARLSHGQMADLYAEALAAAHPAMNRDERDPGTPAGLAGQPVSAAGRGPAPEAEERVRDWRLRWAAHCGIPVEAVPRTVGNPTESALRAAGRRPPGWLVKAGGSPGTTACESSARQAAEEKRQRREAQRAESRRQEALRQEARARARARIAFRAAPPERVVLHLGPTNSGKTHGAIEALAEHVLGGGTATYAAPLRMLAGEVYERLSARLGPEHVGLCTGEERVSPQAPLVCCTAESAPCDDRGLLVVDEAQWLADPERGHAWTRLLASGAQRVVRVAAAPEAEGLLRAAFEEAGALEVVRHERIGGLSFAGPFSAGSVPPGTAVVAFSRTGVLALHRELVQAGRKATVLYGAMPPAARREQIRRLAEGEVEVVVCTDVIGHGVNLPLAAVAFAETSKFDGRERRSLHRWETAQIAGRAGRRGQGCGEGAAGVYRSAVPGFTADAQLVARAVQVANGAEGSGLSVPRAPLHPAWADLGDPAPGEIPAALDGWAAAARREAAGHPWLRPLPVDVLRDRCLAVRDVIGAAGAPDAPWGCAGQTVWRLLTLPVDGDSARFPLIVRAVTRGADMRRLLVPDSRVACLGLAEAEEHAAAMRDVRVTALAFPGAGGVSPDEAASGEEAAAQRVLRIVATQKTLGRAARCERCGEPCAPWFRRCDGCHQLRLGWGGYEPW